MPLTAAVTWLVSQAKKIPLGQIIVHGTIFATIASLASSAWNAISSVFRTTEAAAHDLNQAFDTHLDKLKRLQELYEQHPGLKEEVTQAYWDWLEALGTEGADEAYERFSALGEVLNNLEGEITALEDVVGSFSQEQLNAAINTAIMEAAIGDAADAISSLKTAYQQAFDAAYASISAQLGLFGRMSFEAGKAVTEMAATWGGQAADIHRHNENLLFAIEAELLPGIVSSFSDINEAGNLNEVIGGAGCKALEWSD